MTNLRRALSLLLVFAALSASACSKSITAWDDDCGDIPGSNNSPQCL